MASGTETIRPTAYTSPCSGCGGNACDSKAAYTSTCDIESACGAGLGRDSIAHRAFQSPSYQPWWTSATLKVDWKTAAQSSSEQNCENGPLDTGEFKLEYTLNGGSTWVSFSGFPRGGYLTQKTGTASLSLSVSQDISDVRVRLKCEADGDVCPTGACCYGTLNCICRIDEEGDCEGSYQGDGTDCDPDPCWKPACDPP